MCIRQNHCNAGEHIVQYYTIFITFGISSLHVTTEMPWLLPRYYIGNSMWIHTLVHFTFVWCCENILPLIAYVYKCVTLWDHLHRSYTWLSYRIWSCLCCCSCPFWPPLHIASCSVSVLIFQQRVSTFLSDPLISEMHNRWCHSDPTAPVIG